MKPPTVLMLGKGWFPAELGGLDRYFRELLLVLPEAGGVVVGPGGDAPGRVAVVSDHDQPLIDRLVRFARAARREGSGAELIDVHFALYGIVPLLATSLRRRRLVVHFHGPWAEESLAAGEAADWRIRVKRWLERQVYRRADAAVTLTEAFRQLLIADYGVSPERVSVVRPGVDVSHFSPGDRGPARERFGVLDGQFLVCCARRLVPRMGIDVLLDAWGTVLKGSPRARLIVAGGGPLQKELTDRVAAGGLSESVTIAGRISDAELLALYQAADLNVVPTRSFEGFGLIVLEAAACGTPSVVTDVGGLPEAVTGLGDGLVVPAGDAEALAARLQSALSGALPSRSEVLAWARQQSWEQVAVEHRALYARVLEASRPRSARNGLA